MDAVAPSPIEIREQVDRISASNGFRSSPRLRAFLEFSVERVLSQETDQLKEIVLGTAVCGRSASSFDPRIDPVVRVTARRLRDALEKYYQGPGASDPVLISYPVGAYVPAIQPRVEDTPTFRSRNRGRYWLWSALLLTVFGLGAISIFRRPLPNPRPAPIRFQVPSPEQAHYLNLSLGGAIQVSPDGQHIVFAAVRNRRPDSRGALWVHSFSSMRSSELEGTDDARYPFWSPDSRSVAFFQAGKLRKTNLSGGLPVTVCDAPGGLGGSWSPAGVIIFAPSVSSGLYMTRVEGGPAKPITQLEESAGDLNHLWPHFLPDGQRFLYTDLTETASQSAIYVSSIDHPLQRKRVCTAGTNAAYVRLAGQKAGLLLYALGTSLLAVRFDPERLIPLSDPILLERPVGFHSMIGLADFSASDNGLLVFRGGTAMPSRELVWFDRSGKRLARRLEPAPFRYPQISADGKTIAVSVPDPGSGRDQVWFVNADSDSFIRTPADTRSEFGPVFSPDGQYVAYASSRGQELRRKPVHGASSELLYRSAEYKYPTSWSQDGRYIVFNSMGPSTRYDIWALPLKDERRPIPIVRTPADELDGQVSPDGHWITYNSNRTGTYQLYAERFPPSAGDGECIQLSTVLGHGGRWRRDGRELYYFDGGHLVAVPVQTGNTLQFGAPRPLFDISRLYHSSYGYYPAPDGSRFLFSAAIEEEFAHDSAATVALHRFANF